MSTPAAGTKNRERRQLPDRRGDFPSLLRRHNGYPLAYLDGPAGTQVPRSVIDAVADYYSACNANTHGRFPTSEDSDRLLEEARALAAEFLGAAGAGCISFGANMTTLNYALARGVGRMLQAGDEILVTQLDHEANRGPWLGLREKGIIVNEIGIHGDATLDYDDFERKVNRRTRLVAMGLASNAFGTVNDVSFARAVTERAGAWLLVDAVHYAPHFPVDAAAMGVDLLLCSAYKFYGPHVGILYARQGVLDRLETDRLRTQDQRAPHRIETGTLNHASIAGMKAAIEFIASIGSGADRRSRIVEAMDIIGEHENGLARSLHAGLAEIGGVTFRGPSFESPRRAPTLSFTVEGMSPAEVCAALGGKGICAWDGDFYAVRPMEILGLRERGGVTRVGFSLYNTREEVSRLLAELEALVPRRTNNPGGTGA
ncbi:MAG TPA: cysteine desulfurase-like protein [Bacteroidota bacterium]|nr:cysteine desulfurase-like protein [Bacteroidota bacterium]